MKHDPRPKTLVHSHLNNSQHYTVLHKNQILLKKHLLGLITVTTLSKRSTK